MATRRRLRAVTTHTPTELGAAIAGMTDSQLQCRDFGHSWRPYTAEYLGQRRQYLEVLACQRCKAQRLRLLGQRGELLGNRYVYPDGYLVQGLGRLDSDDRDALRLASLQLLLDSMSGQSKAPKSARTKAS